MVQNCYIPNQTRTYKGLMKPLCLVRNMGDKFLHLIQPIKDRAMLHLDPRCILVHVVS